MTDWGKILSRAEVNNAMRERKKTYFEKTIWRSSLSDESTEGWYFFKDANNKAKVKVHKDKASSTIFENRLWILCASMGFFELNRDDSFEIEYTSNSLSHAKQIDVFAADDETILVIECKCAEKANTAHSWKKDIEAIKGYMQGVRGEIRKKYPNHNVKFIFATQNYVVGNSDRDLMEESGIAYFDETTVKYYEELVKHLGSASRYQLLGRLFANKSIRGMDNRIPAIQGKMGGYTYYTFCIQPEILLKIGYVLHRSEANEEMMPTYQRIIKKSRLKSVHEFIENKGFFPNSLLISVDTKKKTPMRFDLADKQGNDSIAKLGILHLPNEYRSAYIIDGQHRLYGYSDSKYARTNSIPVVAFENMDQEMQVKLFMEINENQKAVSKNLRNTLNADLLWFSDNPAERREALRSKIAQDFGDNIASPLHNRVVIGEDQSDEYCCLKLEIICSALKDATFLSKFNKDQTLQKSGIFDLDDNDKTKVLLEKYLFGCFKYLRKLIPEEWEKNPKEDGILLFNNGIGGMIRLFNDIAVDLVDKGYEAKKIDDFLKETQYYLDPLQDFFRNMSEEVKKELHASYGNNGPKEYWRNVERAVHNARKSFIPEGYEKYWEDHDKTHNENSIKIMANVEKYARNFIVSTLKQNSENWIQEIPKNIYTKAVNEKSKHQYDTGEELPIEQFFNMADLSGIIQYGSNWSTYFEKKFTLPSEIKKTGGKKAKTEWMHTIDKLQKNMGRPNFNVTKQQREMLLEVEKIFLDAL